MTVAYWCVFAAIFFPYLWAMTAKSGPGYDNRAPRAYLAAAQGFRQRANWAHMNAFEAFPPFAAAVIIAQQLHANQATVDMLALGFVACRVAHGLCYVLDRATLRSAAFAGGMACVVSLFVAAAHATS